MSEGSIFLADHLFGETPVRHWVLSLPRPLRYLLAYDAEVLGEVVGAFIGAVFQFLRWKAKRVLGLRSVSLAHPGAVTVIGRCSSDIGLNIHLHTLATDGVFIQDEKDQSVSFHTLPAPTDGEVTGVAWETCRRTLDRLARRGYWEEDQGALAQDEAVPHPLADIDSARVRGVLLMGPRRGQRVVRFHGEAARCQGETRDLGPTGEAFNLHAGQAVRAGDRAARGRPARYILRPVLGRARLSRRSDGGVAVWFKSRWRDGTAGTVFEPLEFLARLSALVWQRGVNTIRFHGVYAAHARLRQAVIPQPPRDVEQAGRCGHDDPAGRGIRLSWAQLLKRVFRGDVFRCPRCLAPGMQRIAWIVDRQVTRAILRAVGLPTDSPVPHPARSPADLFAEMRLP